MATPKLGKGLGRKADIHDHRDLVLEARQAAPLRDVGAPLPTAVDVFHELDLPVYDQGSLGSCTANSAVLYRRFLARRFAKYSAADTDLSRLFLYYQERKLPWNSDVNSDSGAAMRDAVYVLAHIGVCPESNDPYRPADFSSDSLNNNERDISAAAAFRVGAYHRVPDAVTVRQVLASGYAVLLGFQVYPSFEEIKSDGLLPMPKQGEAPLGGHAVVIRGYDDSRACFFIQNSWGHAWGDHGCFWMPYEYIERSEISEPDMWMAHLGKPWRD
ncbi:MAG TPA: C1 family peptidase [Terriglobia bacterium]|nr:C1 family peptidase [Terriglobia bacterium]